MKLVKIKQILLNVKKSERLFFYSPPPNSAQSQIVFLLAKTGSEKCYSFTYIHTFGLNKSIP